MDDALYKDFTTSRGFKYHYYNSPARDSKITLLFCHGFPSVARDWRFVVPYFQAQGYGIIAPDMLGYGGTDKPTDVAAYVRSGIAKDLVDILDAESVNQVVALGHDWGTAPVARLANYYPERILAYAFFSVPYVPPNPQAIDFNVRLASFKKMFGYELYGYWLFFNEDNAENVVNSHWDSFLDILFTADSEIWKTHLAPSGALQASLESDYRGPVESFVTEEERKITTEIFQRNGISAPTNWYKVEIRGLQTEDDKQIPLSRYLPPVSSPIFYAGGKKDAVCVPQLAQHIFGQPSFKDHNITIKNFDAGHWLILSHADEINKELSAWIENVVLATKATL